MDLPDGSKPLTAFETLQGLIQFKTMPFVLVNIRASFLQADPHHSAGSSECR